MKYFALLAILCVNAILVAETTDKIICYYASWAHYYPGIGKLAAADLNATLCTHIVYSFMGITKDGEVKIIDPSLDIDSEAIKNTVALKKVNPNLKVLVAVGEWNRGAGAFSQIAENPDLRRRFIQNSIDFVQEHKLDGMDIDWRYPAGKEGLPKDKENFVILLQEFRSEFDKKGYILIASVSGTRDQRQRSYDVPGLNKHPHYINVMAYDLHGSWEEKTGAHAPFAGTSGYIPGLSVTSIIEQWIQAGASPGKLILGVPFYGRTFTLTETSNSEQGAPSIGPGRPGPLTREAGVLSYAEICNNIKNSGWVEKYDDVDEMPYSFHEDQWVGYDNVRSLGKKIDYAISTGLGGIAVRTIDQDDVKNVCGGGPWTLLTSINKRLESVNSQLNIDPRSGI